MAWKCTLAVVAQAGLSSATAGTGPKSSSICASICGTSSRKGPSAPKGGIEGSCAAFLFLIPKTKDEGQLSGCAIEDDVRGLEADEMRMGGATKRIGAR